MYESNDNKGDDAERDREREPRLQPEKETRKPSRAVCARRATRDFLLQLLPRHRV